MCTVLQPQNAGRIAHVRKFLHFCSNLTTPFNQAKWNVIPIAGSPKCFRTTTTSFNKLARIKHRAFRQCISASSNSKGKSLTYRQTTSETLHYHDPQATEDNEFFDAYKPKTLYAPIHLPDESHNPSESKNEDGNLPTTHKPRWLQQRGHCSWLKTNQNQKTTLSHRHPRNQTKQHSWCHIIIRRTKNHHQPPTGFKTKQQWCSASTNTQYTTAFPKPSTTIGWTQQPFNNFGHLAEFTSIRYHWQQSWGSTTALKP